MMRIDFKEQYQRSYVLLLKSADGVVVMGSLMKGFVLVEFFPYVNLRSKDRGYCITVLSQICDL